MSFLLSALLLAVPPPPGLSKLPEWVRPSVLAALEDPAPPVADVWVVLKREEVTYLGEGRIRRVTRRVLRVESERGLADTDSVVASALGGKAGRVRRIRGYNLRPNGELESVDDSDASTAETGFNRATAAVVSRTQKGSWIAFDTEVDEELPVGPITTVDVMEYHPVRVFELAISPGTAEAVVDLRHLEPWVERPATASTRLVRLAHIPGQASDEKATPHERNATPWILLRFIDPTLVPRKADLSSWDGLAKWTYASYERSFSALPEVKDVSGSGLEALRALRLWFSRETTYRQMYLTPERGLIPLAASEILRRRYGDCKDLATAFMSEAKARGFEVAPALARIVEGRVEDDEPPGFSAFNHVIAAVHVDAPTGLPSEVTTPAGRFVLVDATERLSPLGRLYSGHRGRRILICTARGGHWVTVPAEATVPATSRQQIEGTLDSDLTFKGSLEVLETGGASHLRWVALESGTRGLRDACLQMGLPPTASCEVRRQTDPLDVDHPFEVQFELVQPSAGRFVVPTELQLTPPGFLQPPNLIQKAGRPRELPVEFDEDGVVEQHIKIGLTSVVAPVLPEERGVTALRRYEFSSKVTRTATGSEIVIASRSERTPARFTYADRESGVEAVRKDRIVVRRLRESGLAFKIVP